MLVHGAFADASSWNGVIERLHRQGYTVIAPANPLRGVAADSAYIASLLSQIDGPVLLAGHSYGGAVISNAGASAPNVVGLVFVAAFAPDEGERLGEVASEVQGQHPEHGPSVQLSHRTKQGDRGRVRDQPGAAPGGLCRRSAAGDHGADGRDPASRRGRGVQRRLRIASLEEATVLGRGRHRRQGRREATSSGPWPSGLAPTSSRSRART